ncbi:MAG: acetyl-CoA C-acyltransferase, partial [Bacteroidia bacterium]|nr:acetyl-CoA C-acyltransferase [Bacteroidia bacterium]
MKKVFIVAARRTAIGKFMGSLAPINPGELGAIVIKELIKETGIDPAVVDTVIAGNILSAGQMQGVARQASIKAGIPVEVP